MRRLSGWARLWIILAVVTWGLGGWRLSQTSPPILESALDWCATPGLQPQDMMGTRPCDSGLGLSCEQLRQSQDECYYGYREGTAAHAEMVARNDRTMRRYYLELVTRAAIVFVAPFLTALALWLSTVLVRWVWRGFRPQPN